MVTSLITKYKTKCRTGRFPKSNYFPQWIYYLQKYQKIPNASVASNLFNILAERCQ